MPNYTTNLNLEKPLQSEQYNIDVFNANADKIDQFAGQTPARALTANKLTTGAKINGVNFKGDTDIVTGAGFYYDTVTYGAGDLAFIYNQNNGLELHKSLVAGNIGHNPLTSTGYWEKVELGGSGGRNVGEIIPSTLPLTDAGLHLLDGSLLQYGSYKDFIDYIAILCDNTKTYNPSAFTVQGNPTVSSDGIASNFSNTGYLTASVPSLQNATNFGITIEGDINDISGYGFIIDDARGADYGIALWTSGDNLNFRCNGTSTSIGTLANNDTFKIELNTVNSTTAHVICNINNSLSYDNNISISNMQAWGGILNIGNRGTDQSNSAFDGSIDLKKITITVNGSKILSGTKPSQYFTTEANWQSSVTNYGVCGKFVYDSENNTVRLPKITGIVEGTTDLTALGDLVQAGLPNITGDYNIGHMEFFGSDGAFNTTLGPASNYGRDIASNSAYTSFDASRSSSVYGNSTTVQPQTIKIFYYIVVATSSKTDIQVDIDEIATDLNGKMDLDLSNMNASQSAKNTVLTWLMPDFSNRIDVGTTLDTNGVITYTAPSKGWISTNPWAFGGDAYLSINNVEIRRFKGTSSYWGMEPDFLPVDQGDVIKVYSAYDTLTFSDQKVYFYPMKGVN